MPKSRLLALLTFFAALGACGDADMPPDAPGAASPDAGARTDVGEADAAPVDLGPPDSGLPDIGPRDAGPPPDLGIAFAGASCASCGSDGSCPAGGLCLTAQTGESFCADACDADLDGCIPGFTCVNIAGEGQPARRFCIPPGATCRGSVGFGTPCFEGTDTCVAGLDQCEADLFAPGYCTRSCGADADCPTGYRCGPGDDGAQVCLSSEATAAERCAVAMGRAACATHHDCAWQDGQRCLRSTSRLPGICAAPCGGGCGEGARCVPTSEGELCVPDDCACHASPVAAGQRDLLAEALAAQGLSRCDTVHTLADLAPNPPDLLYDPYRLSFFDEVAHEPLRAPELGRGLVAGLDERAAASAPAPARAAQMLEALARRLDRPAERSRPEALDGTAPLVRAMEGFIRLARGQPDTAAIAADAADLSPELRRALATVVEAMTRAALARDLAIPRQFVTQIYRQGPSFVAFSSAGQGLDPATDEVRTLLNQTLGYGRLFGAGADVLDALAAADLPRFRGMSTRTASAAAAPLFNQPTPFGRIIVGGAEPDIYDRRVAALSGDIALLVDLGGDDVYRVAAGGNRSPSNPVSILVDLGGDDTHAYVEVPTPRDGARLPADDGGRYTPRQGPADDFGPISFSDRPRQGGGRAGTAILWDVGEGRDIYRSLRMSQGSGIFGTGVLIDEGGDDVYELEAVGQGAGTFGIGLLLDLGGNDVRRAYHEAQGFGYARGAGLAYDLAGDDEWLMNVGDPMFGGDPLYRSAQRAGTSNSSLGQGFGFGRRADFTDRAFFSGGIGLLVDAAGRDRYEASIFAQGGGFWFGTGILADHAGDDSYDALWYAMGTGAHYALGLLLEGGGNDSYGGAFPRVNVTIAGAHDYTTAFLVDDAGDDIYWGSRISIGAGNVNGLGFFADNGGDDQYELRRDYGLGGAGNLENDAPGSARSKVKNLGVFIDAGGRDTYTLDGMPFTGRGDDTMWMSSQNDDEGVAASELGTGIDGEGDSTLRAR